MRPVRRGSPSTSPRTRPACLRETAATEREIVVLGDRARQLRNPAQPVAPARHTLSTTEFPFSSSARPETQ